MPWQVVFVLLAATWGCSFWWIKLGLEFLSPVQVSWGRCLLGAAALLVLSAATRVRLPRSARTWGHLFVMAVLLNSVPLTLFAYGETRISSILAGIINGLAPLTTLAATLVLLPGERLTGDRLAGLLLGFLGVLVVTGAWDGVGGGQGLGILACLGAVVCYGLSFAYSRRNLQDTGDSPVALATGQVLLGAVQLAPFGIAAGGLRGEARLGPVLGMVGLGALGTGAAYAWNYRIIREVGPTTASTVTYLVPAFAVLVGTAFLDEPLAWHHPVGAVVVLLGVAAAQGRLRRLIRGRDTAPPAPTARRGSATAPGPPPPPRTARTEPAAASAAHAPPPARPCSAP
jgi:drug/metabolite transporter (DMT)-like permease